MKLVVSVTLFCLVGLSLGCVPASQQSSQSGQTGQTGQQPAVVRTLTITNTCPGNGVYPTMLGSSVFNQAAKPGQVVTDTQTFTSTTTNIGCFIVTDNSPAGQQCTCVLNNGWTSTKSMTFTCSSASGYALNCKIDYYA